MLHCQETTADRWRHLMVKAVCCTNENVCCEKRLSPSLHISSVFMTLHLNAIKIFSLFIFFLPFLILSLFINKFVYKTTPITFLIQTCTHTNCLYILSAPSKDGSIWQKLHQSLLAHSVALNKTTSTSRGRPHNSQNYLPFLSEEPRLFVHQQFT